MGVYSPEQFVGKLGELSAAVDQVPKRGVEAGAKLVKASVQSIAPARLSGVGRSGRGAALGVFYVIQSAGTDATAFIRGRGPWPLIEDDTPAHSIPRENGRKQRYAVIPGVGVFSHVNHPGTRGKHPFERGSLAAIPAAQAVFQTETLTAVSGVFI